MKYRIPLLLMLALLAASCAREKEIDPQLLTLKVGFEDRLPASDDTKTMLSGSHVMWDGQNAADRVLFVFDSEGQKNVFTSTSTATEATRIFKGNISEGSSIRFMLWSGKTAGEDNTLLRDVGVGNEPITPGGGIEFATKSSGVVRTVISSEGSLAVVNPQTPSGVNTFAPDANIAVMNASDGALRNVFGYIRYTVPAGEDGFAAIKSVTFSAEEYLAGPIEIDYEGTEPKVSIVGEGSKELTVHTSSQGGNFLAGTYYAVLSPGTYHNMKITVTPVSGEVFTLSSSTPVTVVRGKYTDSSTLPSAGHPVWPKDDRWPEDPDAFDYGIAESKQALLPKEADTEAYPFPKTVDKVTYGSGVGVGVSSDKMILNRAASASYETALNSGRYMSIKVNRPGTLTFIPRLTSTDTYPTIYVALVTTKNGTTSGKVIFQKYMSDGITSGNYNDLASHRVYIPVTEDDLLGITESATVVVFCTEKQMIIYPLKWIVNLDLTPDYDVDSVADARKAKVLNAPNTINPATFAGTCYYVSNEGSDTNDGRSPATPIKTLQKLANLGLKPGDAVLFRRGDTWRRSAGEALTWNPIIDTKPGVTYSAYGEGEKPKILGSPWNAAREGTWTLTSTRNVYEYDASFHIDGVGTILLDEKECAQYAYNLSSPSQLRTDKTYYQDGDKLYFCSTGGNPSNRFSSMELFLAGHGFRANQNVTIDNICIRYVGSHGIGTGTNLHSNFTVTNCEVGWIGGSWNHPGESSRVRYGNGIQLWGGCESFKIKNCWVYECWDAGVTHQYSSANNDDCLMENITYRDNLLENNLYNIEYFIGTVEGKERKMRNILIDGNICRTAGYGWGIQRGGSENLQRQIQAWGGNYANQYENFVISNNIFDRCSAGILFNVEGNGAAVSPTFVNNYCRL